MLRIGPAVTLPENFSHFVDEMAPELGALYGPGAEAEYRRNVRRGMSANIAHPAIQAYCATDRGRTAGIVLAIEKAAFAEVGLVHVLASHRAMDTEERLIRAAVTHLRDRGCAGIVCECVPVSGVALTPGFEAMGFQTVARQIMVSPLETLARENSPTRRAVALRPAHWRSAAACLVDAYRDHPGRLLHAEVHDLPQAQAYIARVAAGNYGAVPPGGLCAVMDGDACHGVGLGCRIAPGAGFVLQLAVRRAHQGAGLGSVLLRSMARAFRDSGLEKAYLGVTRDNPARERYGHLGFTPLRDVKAYVWGKQS